MEITCLSSLAVLQEDQQRRVDVENDRNDNREEKVIIPETDSAF